MIYLAPIQGFTDFVYRKAYSETFTGIDTYFIPYITIKNNRILKKYEKEIRGENNPQKHVVPQVLVKNDSELLQLSELLNDFGYSEINLNLGCPYPMVTNRGKGAGLLPFPARIEKLLSAFFKKTDLKLSVKIRLGLSDSAEVNQLIPVFNNYPLTEVIVHPRTASQMYSGDINESAFSDILKSCTRPLVCNGGIFSLPDYYQKRICFQPVKNWMIGRGVLMNPFLPAEINGESFSIEERREKLIIFHNRIFEGYSETCDNAGNTLNKMKQFWIYFIHCFSNSKKTFKNIKKARSLNEYLAASNAILKLNDIKKE